MLPSTLPPTPNPTLSLLHKLHFNAHFIRIRPISKSHICLAFPPSNQNPMGEEARWLREEQRWLREEQRWLREESRWNAERQALLQEINSLQLRIQELERLNSQQGASASENVAKLVQVLKEGDLVKNANRIADSGTSALPLVVEAAENEEEIVVKQVISTPEKKETIIKGETLRIGSEGDEVQAMQRTNGAPVASNKDISEVSQTVGTEDGATEVDLSRHRVFLLGENRWEEPSRLTRECDGTGEPNVEPQFMEWVDEGSKCPHCEGLGYTTCDACGGKTSG